jgi:site-specific recombinase XerD
MKPTNVLNDTRRKNPNKADATELGPLVRRFLLEHLVGERNLARNTQQSYRDTLRLMLPFMARQACTRIERLTVEALTAQRVRAFLLELETKRHCAIATRNQRLAAIHSLAHFIARRAPEYIGWSGELCAIPFKRCARPGITYLEKTEMDGLLAAPDINTAQGRRDYGLLLFLYNTGARADETAHVQIKDLTLGATPSRDCSSVVIRGKGSKLRHCPLWNKTVQELSRLIRGRPDADHVFLNRQGHPLTRYGIHAMVERYAKAVGQNMPSLKRKRVSPHTIRHTTATHLLRAGVDINTIRAWLGHVSLNTTNIYAEVDLEMKAKALARCEVSRTTSRVKWRDDKDLMKFLRNL